MKHIQGLKMLAVAAAIAAPFCLMVSAPVFAAKPKPVCIVGHTHANIQLAINDTSCEFINVPAGTFDENLVIMRDVEIRGAGPDSTIVRGITGAVFSIYSLANSPTTLPVVTLKGMTMTNGKPRPQGSPRWDGCWGGGGGIEISLSEVTVKDSYITDNVTQTTYCPGPYGGAPYTRFGQGGGINSFRTTLIIKDSVISDNVADRCGGIRIGSNNTSTPPSITTIMDSIIADNRAIGVGTSLGIGGGMCITNLATVTVKDTAITGNTAVTDGGGIWNNFDGTLTVKDSTLTNNSAGNLGGGIYNTPGGTLLLKDSTLTGNSLPEIAP